MHLEISEFDDFKQFICQSYKDLSYSINNLRIYFISDKMYLLRREENTLLIQPISVGWNPS